MGILTHEFMKYPPRLALLAKEVNMHDLLAAVECSRDRQKFSIKVDDETGATIIYNDKALVVITSQANFNFTSFLDDDKHSCSLFILTGKSASVSKNTQAQLTALHVPLMKLSEIKPVNDCARSLMQFKSGNFCDEVVLKLMTDIFTGLTAELIIKFLTQLI